MPKPPPPMPAAVRRALTELGADLSAARRRRRLSQSVVAARALTTRQTIARIEDGDPSVAWGTWATVFFVLGLLDRLKDAASPAQDELGLALARAQLPRRVRVPQLRGTRPKE